MELTFFFLFLWLLIARVTVLRMRHPIAELTRLLKENRTDCVSKLGSDTGNFLYSEEVRQLYQTCGQMAAAVKEHNEYMEMEKLDRLHLIGEMAASIGHEVRNPLTTVRGLLQLMDMKEQNSQAKDKFKLMIEEVDRANSIITEFLSLAKNKSILLMECRLDGIIRALLPFIEAEALLEGKSIKVDLKSKHIIFADDKEIKQLLLNLARNSFEAMQPGGTLEIYTLDIKDKVMLIIRDTGRGIPEHVLEKLGTPFVTTKDCGTGLGLPVCYSIAARHKAEFRVETSDRGTSFFIYFPQAGTIADWPGICKN
jgi:signal transduction histidine kinase